MLGAVLLNKDLPIYEYQNTELTINDQTWIRGIAGLCNLERRNETMPTSDRLLFHQLRLGVINPRPNYDNPKDMATRAMRYSALLVEHLWTMVDRERARVRDVVHQHVAETNIALGGSIGSQEDRAGEEGCRH